LKTKKVRNLPIANHGLFVRIICRIDEEICVVYAVEAVFISGLLENYPLLLSFYGARAKDMQVKQPEHIKKKTTLP